MSANRERGDDRARPAGWADAQLPGLAIFIEEDQAVVGDPVDILSVRIS